MDQKPRKLMTMHKALYPRDNDDRLYVSRREGGRILTSNEDSIDTSIQRLKDCIEKRGGRLITATRNNTNNTRTSGTTMTRRQTWEEKQFYERFKRPKRNISHGKTWTWLRKGKLKRETESLLIVAQNSVIRTNYIKAKIDKTQQIRSCRLWRDRDETINPIISECNKLAQKEYKTRHDWVGKVIDWELCKNFKFDHTNKWYMHNSESVRENETHTTMGFWHANGSPNLSLTTRPHNNQQKKRELAKLWTLLFQLTTE